MVAFSAAALELTTVDAAAADAMGVDDVSAAASKKILLSTVASLPEVLGSTLTDVAGASQATTAYRSVNRNTTGTPANGIGYGFQVTVQTAATTLKVGGAWRIQATDVTAASEDFKWVYSLMVAGAPATDIAEIDSAGINLLTGKVVRVNAVQVLGARVTGYSAMTGTANKAAVYDTASVTLAQLAGRVMQLQADLTAHGMLGA